GRVLVPDRGHRVVLNGRLPSHLQRLVGAPETHVHRDRLADLRDVGLDAVARESALVRLQRRLEVRTGRILTAIVRRLLPGRGGEAEQEALELEIALELIR